MQAQDTSSMLKDKDLLHIGLFLWVLCCDSVAQGAALAAAQDRLEGQRQDLLAARLDLDRWVK